MKRLSRFNTVIPLLILTSSTIFAQDVSPTALAAVTQSTTTTTAPVTTATPLTTTPGTTTPATTSTQNTTATSTTIPTVAVVSDAEIMSNIQSKLSQDMTLSGVNINVAANNGIVTLSGTTLTQAQIDEAVRMTKTITGVKEVMSKLVITPNTTTMPSETTTPSY